MTPDMLPQRGKPAVGARRLQSVGPAPASVPRVFQVLVVLFALLTGTVPSALQAALFGLTGGGEAEFLLALVASLMAELVRIACLFALARHPLGVLHPLVVVLVLWPLLFSLPTTIEELGGFSGLLAGEPVSPQFYLGLPWRPPAELWLAEATVSGLTLLSILAIYAGFFSGQNRFQHALQPAPAFDAVGLRRLVIGLILVSLFAVLVLVSVRGGFQSHIADLARGRFRSLAGLGPLVALVDLGTVSLVLWTAIRPRDARSPVFLVCLLAVAAAQFLSNGSRSGALALFMVVGLGWALRTRRVPWRLALLLAPLIFIALGALGIVRASGQQNGTALEVLQSAGGAGAYARIQEEIAVRRSIGASVPVVADGHSVTGGPLLGQSYLAAIGAFIPRALWEAKPRGPGSLYAQLFLGGEREGSAIPVPPVPEAYWNFHLPGVLVIFFLYGLLLKKASGLLARHPENPFTLALFVLFVTTFGPGTDYAVAFQQQAALLLLIYILARLLVRRQARVSLHRRLTPDLMPIRSGGVGP